MINYPVGHQLLAYRKLKSWSAHLITDPKTLNFQSLGHFDAHDDE